MLRLTAAYLLLMISVYYFLNWIPSIVVELGFPPSAAARVSAVANLSGVAGGLLLGWASPRLGLRRMALAAILGLGLTIMAFGYVASSMIALLIIAAVAGGFLFGGMVGLSAVIASSFPTYSRSTATGFLLGVRRVGNALAPAGAGLLFSAGFAQGEVSLFMGVPAILAAFVLAGVPVGTVGGLGAALAFDAGA